jgi:hypothetical protein
MRYISFAENLALITVDGTVKYQFRNGTLDLGSGNEIVPDLSGTNASSKLFDFSGTFGDTSSDLARAGQGYLFWQSPIITSATALSNSKHYKVVNGSIVYSNQTYTAGERFYCISGTTSFTGSGTVCFDVPQEYYVPKEVNTRKESFKKIHLAKGDEATWNEGIFGAPAENPADVS